MRERDIKFSFCFVMSVATLSVLCSVITVAQTLPSETPQKFEPTNYGFDFERREVMIAMRDGVKLHTVILVPKGSKNAPMLMTRTPYNASALTTHAQSAHLGPNLHYNNDLFGVYDNAADIMIEGGYIRVV